MALSVASGNFTFTASVKQNHTIALSSTVTIVYEWIIMHLRWFYPKIQTTRFVVWQLIL